MAELKMLKPLNTLEGMPYDQILVLNGFNYTTNSYRNDAIKDWITIKYGYGTTVHIYLFSNSSDALEDYFIGKNHNKIQSEVVKTENDRYFITYIEQIRSADQLYLPTDNYTSGVYFLKENIIIEFLQTNSSKDIKEKEKSISTIARYIRGQIRKQA